MGVFERVRRVKSLGFWESGWVWRAGVGKSLKGSECFVGLWIFRKGYAGFWGVRRGQKGSEGIMRG